METKKTEIEEMPEGISSEELDALTTGEEVEKPEKLTQKATEEPSPAEEPAEDKPKTGEEEETPPEPELSETEQQLRAKDSKIASQKHTVRELELEKARLEGELKARKDLQVAEPNKSPLEIAEAAYLAENNSMEGFSISPALYRQQRAFENQEASTKATTDSQQQVNTAAVQAENDLQVGELSERERGQGLDLQTVAGIGTHYLTKGDRVDIADIVQTKGSKAGLKVAYNKMIERTLAANNEDSKLLKMAIDKSQTKPEPKEEEKPTDIDALTTEGTELGEAEMDTPSQRLTNFIFSPDD